MEVEELIMIRVTASMRQSLASVRSSLWRTGYPGLRAVFGRCQTLFATIRMVYITLYMLLTQVVDAVNGPSLLISIGRQSQLKNI